MTLLQRLLFALTLVFTGSSLFAQENHTKEIVRETFLDPTTYVPTTIAFAGLKLDWKSSQPMFDVGYVEMNRSYTKSGRPRDVPVSYSEGNKLINHMTVNQLGLSIATNASIRTFEHLLFIAHPEHKKLIRAFGWTARIVVGGYNSYYLSEGHFRQWKKNQEMFQNFSKNAGH